MFFVKLDYRTGTQFFLFSKMMPSQIRFVMPE